MRKLVFEVELEYDDALAHGENLEDLKWFFTEVLAEELILQSDKFGDAVGILRIKNPENLYKNMLASVAEKPIYEDVS